MELGWLNGPCYAHASVMVRSVADVGIAIGKHTGEVVRSCADVCLQNGSLSGLLCAVEAGRSLRLGLQKSLAYSLGHVPSQLLAAVLGMVVGAPQPLSHLMSLFFNTVLEVGRISACTFLSGGDCTYAPCVSRCLPLRPSQPSPLSNTSCAVPPPAQRVSSPGACWFTATCSLAYQRPS